MPTEFELLKEYIGNRFDEMQKQLAELQQAQAKKQLCVVCKKEFKATRKDRKYCSSECKTKSDNAKQKILC